MKYKKFIIFAYYRNDFNGALNDIVGSADTVEDAIHFLNDDYFIDVGYPAPWTMAHIVDRDAWETVRVITND